MMKIDKTFLLTSDETTIQQFEQLATELERQELDAPDGIAPPQIYGQLLAIYLLQNDLSWAHELRNTVEWGSFLQEISGYNYRPNAKYLWKRIPSNIKEENPEIVKLWSVGQNLWQCISNVYGLLNEEWPEYLKAIVNAITDTTRRRAFNLISKAYTSISVEKVSAFLGMPSEDCIEVLSSLGWEVDTAGKWIIPKNNDNKQEETIMSEEQLAKLTDLVSFLEN